MNKEKLARIKQKIMTAAPAIITFTATVGITAIVLVTIKKTIISENLLGDDYTLPIITGDEKSKIMEREDTILQQIEDDLYFLSVGVTKTED